MSTSEGHGELEFKTEVLTLIRGPGVGGAQTESPDVRRGVDVVVEVFF